jgi:predicted dehydrogenase
VSAAGRDDAIRVAIVGYGLAGATFHAPLVAATPGLRLTTVVTRDPTRRAQALADHPGVRVAESAERLWERPRDLDLVVIASPNRTHVPLARAALDAGLPAVVDKPLAATAADARALQAAARERGLLLTVFQNRRWDGDFLTLRRLIADGALGAVHRFESRFDRWRPTPKAGWRESGAPDEAGGLLFDLGSHLVDQALVLFGPATHVYAELDRRRPGVEVDDDAFVALTHRSGVRSHLGASVLAAQLGPRMRALGSEAAYTKFGLDVQEDALRAGGRPGGPGWGEEPRDRWGVLGAGAELRAVPTAAGDYPRFYAGVVAALRSGAPAPVDVADAIAALEVIEAARRSAAERRVVALGPDAPA